MVEIEKIKCHIVFEVMGKPKEHVEKTMRLYIDKLKEDSKKYVVLEENIADAADQGDDFFSTFAEVDILCDDLSVLIGLCFDYMPSSVEIISPNHLVLSHRLTTNFVNDLLAKLHTVDMALKTSKTENGFLKKNINSLITNLILISLKQSHKNSDSLAKLTGINVEELKPYLDALCKLGKIEEENGVYLLAK